MEKLLEARVKQDYNMGSVVAFSGHEYTKTEWRPVPLGSEKEAQAHPFLDSRVATNEPKNEVVSVQPQGEPAAAPEVVEEKPARKTRKAKEEE